MDAKKLVNVLNEASGNSIEKTLDTVNDAQSAINAGKTAFGKIANVRKTVGRVSKNSLLQFPLLVSSSLSEETLIILNKALEHDYISLILLALNNILVSEIKPNDTLGDVLKRIHTNIDVTTGEMLSNYAKASGSDTITIRNEEVEGFSIESVTFEDSTDAELNRLNEQSVLYPIGEELNSSILNHATIPEVVLKEARGEKLTVELDGGSDDHRSAYKDNRKVNDFKNSNKQNDGGSIKSIDYKKLNTLAPTLVKCKIAVSMKDSKQINYVDIMFGVKTVLHPIDSGMYVEELNEIFKTNKFPVRLVKWLTGEMKTRDFLFNLTAAKKRALKTHGKNAEANGFWWTKLRELAKSDRAIRTTDKITAIGKGGKGAVGDDGYLSAVTTMVISKSEALQVKNKLGSNMMQRPEILDDVFETLFIMNFIVVDEAGKVAYMYDINRKCFTYNSLNALRMIAKDELNTNGESSIFNR